MYEGTVQIRHLKYNDDKNNYLKPGNNMDKYFT